MSLSVERELNDDQASDHTMSSPMDDTPTCVTHVYIRYVHNAHANTHDMSNEVHSPRAHSSPTEDRGKLGGGLQVKEHPVLGIYVKDLTEIMAEDPGMTTC